MPLLAEIAALPAETRAKVLDGLTPDELGALSFDWPSWARPNQLPPDGAWRTWLYLAGRGAGKTKAGAEWVRQRVERGTGKNIAMIAPTASVLRDVMIDGPSGILSVSPPWFRPVYESSKLRLTWPNGAVAHTYSAQEPERLRGLNLDTVWADELAAWDYPDDAWDMLMFGLRIGDPRAMVTTTPKPLKLIRSLLASPDTAITRGSTYENRANLSPHFFSQILRKYEGTRLGRQELHAEILDDFPGALWTWSLFEREGFRLSGLTGHLTRLVVAIDPAATSGEESDETGIIVAGRDKDFGYVLEDLSCQATPDGWARRAVEAYHRHHADAIIAEANNGGEMVEYTLRTIDPRVKVVLVHASRGKRTRAEPISAMYEQGRMRHVGLYPELEEQMVSWTPDSDDSPDRMDALVWAFSELFLEHAETSGKLVW